MLFKKKKKIEQFIDYYRAIFILFFLTTLFMHIATLRIKYGGFFFFFRINLSFVVYILRNEHFIRYVKKVLKKEKKR